MEDSIDLTTWSCLKFVLPPLALCPQPSVSCLVSLFDNGTSLPPAISSLMGPRQWLPWPLPRLLSLTPLLRRSSSAPFLWLHADGRNIALSCMACLHKDCPRISSVVWGRPRGRVCWLSRGRAISHQSIWYSVSLHTSIIVGICVASACSLMETVSVWFSLKFRVVFIMVRSVTQVILKRFLLFWAKFFFLDVIASVSEQHLCISMVGTICWQEGLAGHLGSLGRVVDPNDGR